MKLTKKEIEGMQLPPETLAELLGMFDDVTAKESELTKLRAKVPTDSQTVVESVDHQKFLDATKELETLKASMQQKLTEDVKESGGIIPSAFAHFFS